MARNYRYKHWNYKGRGVYMITMNIDGRKPLLGVLKGEADGAWVEYSQLGKAVSEQIEQAFAQYPQVKICAKQLMPDHLHFVVWVQQALSVSLGEIIRKLKIGCTHAYWEIDLHMNVQSTNATDSTTQSTNATNSTTLSTNATDSTTQSTNATNSTTQSTDDTNGEAKDRNKPSLFEKGFHDRIMLHANQLQNMIRYVHDNPRRLALKRANPQLFKLHQQVQVVGYSCTTLGNQFLLDYPEKAVVQCSRRLTQAEIDQLKEQCLAEAERGVVFVSAGISEGEKQICRALREDGFPLIMLLKDGFPKPDDSNYKYFKPQGVYFEACAEGRLLLIEPSEELYESKTIEAQVYSKASILPHDTQRYRFLALNELAKNCTTNHDY